MIHLRLNFSRKTNVWWNYSETNHDWFNRSRMIHLPSNFLWATIVELNRLRIIGSKMSKSLENDFPSLLLAILSKTSCSIKSFSNDSFILNQIVREWFCSDRALITHFQWNRSKMIHIQLHWSLMILIYMIYSFVNLG